MLCRTVPDISQTSCNTVPTCLRKSALSNWRTSLPSTNTAPSVGTRKPWTSLESVVFPDPTRPIMATFSPALMRKEILSKPPVCWSGYLKETFLNSMSPFTWCLGTKLTLGGCSRACPIKSFKAL